MSADAMDPNDIAGKVPDAVEHGVLFGALAGLVWAIKAGWLKATPSDRPPKIEPVDVREAVLAMRADMDERLTRIEAEIRRTTDAYEQFVVEEKRVHDALFDRKLVLK